MEEYIYKNHKKLRYGYTTGSCAAAASKAAAAMLLSGKEISDVELMTPKGIALRLEVLEIHCTKTSVSCAIRKDGGDDPDVTNGILIYAEVTRIPADELEAGGERILIDGGRGVGRVTKPGLEQPVGAAAINKVPRQMIRENLEAVCEQYHYHGKLSVVISIPSGVELAAKTGDKVQVLIETVGTKDWSKRLGIASDHTQRYRLDGGKLVLEDDSLGQEDSTQASTLSDFIRW